MFMLLIGFVAVAPIIYKDDIIELIKEQSNENLNADLNFDDIDLSLLSTFPSMTLDLNNLTISGKDTFADIKLLDLNKLSLKLDLWKIVIDGEYEVKSISLDKPKIYVKVLSNGMANYDIYNSSDTTSQQSTETVESSPLEFKISNYEITNASIIYDDASYATKLKLEDLNHFGSFKMIGDKYLMETTTNVNGLDLNYEQVNYFQKSKADIVFNGEIEFIGEELKMVISESILKINQFKLSVEGDFLMSPKDYLMNLSISTLDQDFKSLFSIVPGVYKQDFSSINTNGAFDFQCLINGVYSDSLVPKIDMDLAVNDGFFKYPDLPNSVENIDVKLDIDFPGGHNLDLLKINLNDFSLSFLNSSFSSNIYASNLISDPFLKSVLISKIDLLDISKVYPIKGQEFSGIISTNINLEGNLSTIEQERYDEFNASGKLNVSEMEISFSDLDYDIDLKSLEFEFFPDKLSLNKLTLLVGESDFSMNGELVNYLPYVLEEEKLKGSFNVASSLIDVDQLYVDSSSETSSESIQNTVEDTIEVNELYEIPQNIDFTFSTEINNLIYDSLTLEAIKGVLLLKNGVLNFNEIEMKIFNGLFKMNGNYKTSSIKRAQLILDMDLSNISFDQAYLYFNTVKKYAPAVKYFEGNFSTTLNMDLTIDENYLPIYDLLYANGSLKSKGVKILDLPALKKLDKLDKSIIEKNNKIKDLNLSFNIKNGRFTLDPTNVQLKDFQAKIYGSTSMSQEINYNIESQIPLSLIDNNFTKGITNFLSKKNDSENKIPVSFIIGGTVLSPTYKTNISINKGDLKGNLISTVKEKVDDLKYEALKEAQKKADLLIEEAKKKANLIRKEAEVNAVKIETEAKKQNRNAKDEIKKKVAQLKQEAIDEANKLESKASSPIAKIAAKKTGQELKKSANKQSESLEKKLTKEADNALDIAIQKAKKVRSEGNKKADLLEQTTKFEADKLIEAAKKK